VWHGADKREVKKMGEIDEIYCDWCERTAKKRYTLFGWKNFEQQKVFCSNECTLAYLLKKVR